MDVVWVVEVQQNLRKEKKGGGLVGGMGVTGMEYHYAFERWEADNQSDVASESKSSQASTLSPQINTNTFQYLITVNHGQQRSYTGIKRNIKSTVESSGNRFSDSFVEL